MAPVYMSLHVLWNHLVAQYHQRVIIWRHHYFRLSHCQNDTWLATERHTSRRDSLLVVIITTYVSHTKLKNEIQIINDRMSELLTSALTLLCADSTQKIVLPSIS